MSSWECSPCPFLLHLLLLTPGDFCCPSDLTSSREPPLLARAHPLHGPCSLCGSPLVRGCLSPSSLGCAPKAGFSRQSSWIAPHPRSPRTVCTLATDLPLLHLILHYVHTLDAQWLLVKGPLRNIPGLQKGS
uniref:Secreted protein n=1 Tax=Mustela putorius furo TaxID=9669 RepID=M3XZY3_MUSPF